MWQTVKLWCQIMMSGQVRWCQEFVFWNCKSSLVYSFDQLLDEKGWAFKHYTMNISFKRAKLKRPGRWGLENWQFRVIALTGSYLTMLPNCNWRRTTKCQAPILPEICHCKLYLVNLFKSRLRNTATDLFWEQVQSSILSSEILSCVSTSII